MKFDRNKNNRKRLCRQVIVRALLLAALLNSLSTELTRAILRVHKHDESWGKPSCMEEYRHYSLKFGATVAPCEQDIFNASAPSHQEREELREDLEQKTLVEIELDDDATLDDIMEAQSKVFESVMYGYRSVAEMQNRSKRFPNVNIRLQLYLSTWYLPP